MKEELRLVESFSELRVGMIVVTKPCNWCGSTGGHRGILAAFDGSRVTRNSFGGQSEGPSFLTLPMPPCSDRNRWVTRDGVDHRIIYRVVDHLEDSQSTTMGRPARKPARV